LSEISKRLEKDELRLKRCEKEKELWIKAEVQLAYVLPKGSHKIMKERTYKYLEEHHKELYPKKNKYQWDYCRYIWEIHPIIPEITLEQLLIWNKDEKHF
jgi:hypothetical protein